MGLGEETPDLSGIVLVHLNDDMQVEAVVYRAEDNQEGIVAIGSRTAENWVPMVIAQLGQDGRIIGLLDLLAHPTQQPNIFSVVENEIGITLFPLVPTNDPMHGILAETMIDTIIDDVMQRSRPIAPLGINGGLSP